MRRVALCVLAVLPLFAALERPAAAHYWRRKNIGIGLVLGDPTGITLDIRPTRRTSFEIDVGLDTFDDRDGGYAHLAYEVRLFDLTHTHSLAVPLYLGVGVFVADHGGRDFDNGILGARFPIGINFEFAPPVAIFLELAVQVALVDFGGNDIGDRVDLGGAVGFRLYF